MKNIYIFNRFSQGSQFGIGTYIQQLLQLKIIGYRMHVIYLHSNMSEVSYIEKEGVVMIHFPNPVSANFGKKHLPSYYTNVIRILREYIDFNAENIYHLHYFDMIGIVMSIKKYMKGKTVLTIHYSNALFKLKGNVNKLREIIAIPKHENENPMNRFIREEIAEIRQLVGYIDKVISISNHSYLQNNDLYHLENKNVMIYNAIQDIFQIRTNKMRTRKVLGIPQLENVIVYAGRLDEMKGVQYLLQALTIVKNNGYNFHLFIVGKGDFDATFNYVHKLYTNITFTGFLNKCEVYKLFSVADFGVLPSLYDEFGYVILEMMMYKLPVVAYRTSGPSEIIEDKKTGLLADLSYDDDSQSVKNLSEKISFLLDHQKERRRMGIAGRERFLNVFSLDLFLKKMESFYSSL